MRNISVIVCLRSRTESNIPADENEIAAEGRSDKMSLLGKGENGNQRLRVVTSESRNGSRFLRPINSVIVTGWSDN